MMKLTTSLLAALALSAQALTVPVDVTHEGAQRLSEAAEHRPAPAQGPRTTRRDLGGGECSDLIVIFARGTQERGSLGTLVGPHFLEALQTALGSSHTVEMQGVDYAATVDGYLAGGDPEGSQEMASLVTRALSSCPSSKIVVSGYSQGGQLVHNAAGLLPAETMEAVSAVVTFGDPYSSQNVENIDPDKVLVICHWGDVICQSGNYILPSHLTYARDVATAAAFVLSKAGF